MKLQFLPRTRSFLKSANKSSFVDTDIESSCGKLTPQGFQSQKKRKPITKSTQIVKPKKTQIFHERIFRFSIKCMRKTMRIYQYKESDMGWPRKFTKQLCVQEMDNDVQSDSEIIVHQVQKCKQNLFQQIERRKEADMKASFRN